MLVDGGLKNKLVNENWDMQNKKLKTKTIEERILY